MDKIDILFFCSYTILLLVMGALSHKIYFEVKQERLLNGMFLKNYEESQAYKVVESADKNGDWICINVNNMDVETMISTCQHEAAHEIFAEYCEKDISRCLDVLN